MLARYGVLAYLCSHILAFDAQVHDGILQLVTAGAGTAHRMPPESEFLHAMQLALDPAGLRYQVLDEAGRVRESLAWPLTLPPSPDWPAFTGGALPAPPGWPGGGDVAGAVAWRCAGTCAAGDSGAAQTLVSCWGGDGNLAHLWIGLAGRDPFLAVQLGPTPGRSPHLWRGPTVTPGAPFDVQIALHTGLGPGGVLWRAADDAPWSSLTAAAPWGPERLVWPERWGLGHGQSGPHDRPFRRRDLTIRAQTLALHLDRSVAVRQRPPVRANPRPRRRASRAAAPWR